MKLAQTPAGTVVLFSATEAAVVGLPSRGAQVEYDSVGRLDGYSTWLDKSQSFGPGIDRLIAIADTLIH